MSRILYPVDLSTPVHHGLAPAGELARRTGAELLLAHAIDFPYPYMSQVSVTFDVERYYGEMEAAVQSRLDEAAAQVPDGVPTRTIILRGNPARRIVELATDESVDVIVMPTHARRGFERLLVGSVTEKVSRLSEVPVLTIPPTDEPATGLEVGKILFPTDFSAPADSALDEALDIAEEFGADLLMLHVVTIGDGDPANPDWAFPAIPPEHVEQVERVAADELESRGHRTPDRVSVTTRLVRGFDPATEVARVAGEEDADVIVMATHGHTGLMHALLGSTTGKVIRLSPCPVWTVRAD
jgi:nucleotide-binding universal stress UspA family protein